MPNKHRTTKVRTPVARVKTKLQEHAAQCLMALGKPKKVVAQLLGVSPQRIDEYCEAASS